MKLATALPIVTLAMSALAFADAAPNGDIPFNCTCCGGGAILLLVGLVFLLDRGNKS